VLIFRVATGDVFDKISFLRTSATTLRKWSSATALLVFVALPLRVGSGSGEASGEDHSSHSHLSRFNTFVHRTTRDSSQRDDRWKGEDEIDNDDRTMERSFAEDSSTHPSSAALFGDDLKILLYVYGFGVASGGGC
jgi:hypothetical protein